MVPFLKRCGVGVRVIKMWEILFTLNSEIKSPILKVGVFEERIDRLVQELFESVRSSGLPILLITQFLRKPKVHYLLHVVEDLQRFGPSFLFCAQTFESLHANLRTVYKSTNGTRVPFFILQKSYLPKAMTITSSCEAHLVSDSKKFNTFHEISEIANVSGLNELLVRSFLKASNLRLVENDAKLQVPRHAFGIPYNSRSRQFAVIKVGGKVFVGLFILSLDSQRALIRTMSAHNCGVTSHLTMKDGLSIGRVLRFFNAQHECGSRCTVKTHQYLMTWHCRTGCLKSALKLA